MSEQGFFKYIRANPQNILFFCIILAVTIASFQHLTAWPRLFYDEGITIEIAENFRRFGVLDISTAPGKFTDIPYVTGSNGFPVTLPLALFFNLFGFGLTQARIYALLWLVIFFAVFYFFAKRFWSNSHALSAILLIATFAPLYDNGRRVLGEIPGFVFLLAGLYFLIVKNKSLAAGIFFGLATVSKPSTYLLIFPAFLIAAIFINRELRKKILPILIGMSPALIAWILFAFPNPLLIETWSRILLFYQNPAASASLFGNFIKNASLFLSHTTLIYFSLILIFICWTMRQNRQSVRNDIFLSFLLPYGILLLLYFLKSPGWLKYLLPLQLFILMIFPRYLQIVLAKINKIKYYHAIIAALSLLQLTQLLFFSNITNATSEPEEIAKFLAEKPGMVGILNSPHISALIPAERKFHYLTQNDLVIIGESPLDLPQEKLPKFLVIPSGFDSTHPFSEKQKRNLEHYKLIKTGEWKVFEMP